ncbi:hypothetical protein JCM24511_04080 [Saitozyma sp. JCM 24511]|nr:hypothetical protein JCM24511_04080 [Saitozyma sp. JCM 24511]
MVTLVDVPPRYFSSPPTRHLLKLKKNVQPPGMNDDKFVYDCTVPGWFIANNWPVLQLRHLILHSGQRGSDALLDASQDHLPALDDTRTIGCLMQNGKCNMEAYIVAATVCALHDVDHHGSKMIRTKEIVEHVRLFVKNQRWVFSDYMPFWATRVDEEMVDPNEVTLWEAYKKEWDEPERAEIQVPRVSGRDEWAQAANPHRIQRL